MKLTVKHFFDAAHMLQDSNDLISKGCANFHGHTYYVIVSFEGNNSAHGMVVDFKAVKNLIDEFDHTAILEANQFNKELANLIHKQKPDQQFVWLEGQPTAENIALEILNKIRNQFPVNNIEVSLCEGYKGQVRSSWVTVKE